MITIIKNWFGFGGNDNDYINNADALVTEFNEISNNPVVDETVEATVENVERIANDGVFHTYSVARIDFDLGEWGSYPVELALPRFPEEESEVEEFMDSFGLEVADLPRIEEGNFTVPFARVNGEWQINWDEIETNENEEDEE